MVAFPILLTLPIGCSGDNALEERQKQFRYTPERLANETSGRLIRFAEPRKRNQRVDADTTKIHDLEADRGGGEIGRPDPNTMQAIVGDVVQKRGLIESSPDATRDANEAARAAFLVKIDSSTEIDTATKRQFIEELQESLPPLQNPAQ